MRDDTNALKRKLGYLSKAKTGGKNNPDASVNSSFPVTDNWQQMGTYTFVRRKKVEIHGVDTTGSVLTKLQWPEAGFGLEDLLFFDTETTGLSGGAGSLVFLLGLGWFSRTATGYEFHIEQVFLDDFPGEQEYIAYLAGKLPANRVYVSYNGKTFDSHLLKSRFLMNGRELELPHQLDLLHLIRTFCKSTLDTCSLSCVERELLRIYRGEDIPGALVPDVYLSYLRHRQTSALALVFNHNYQDILSLAQLYVLLERVLDGEELPVPLDWSRVGEYLLKKGHSSAIHLLEKVFKRGDLYAGQVLSLYYKRLGCWEEALAVWQAMSAKQSFFAKMELAKYFEHRTRDYANALHWVKILEKDYRKYGFKFLNSTDTHISLLKRKQRLLRKLGLPEET